MGNFKNAEENYKKAIYLNPNRPETYNNIGSLYIETGKYDEAIPYLLKCIEISPEFYIAYFNLGMAYYLKKDYEKAKEYFKKTLEIKPDFKPARDIIYKNEKNIHN
jgi:tetratricopeptide (TPR) repeat protein